MKNRTLKTLVLAALLFAVGQVQSQEIALQLYSLREQMKTDVQGTHALLPPWGIRFVEGGSTYGLSLEAYQELLTKNGLQVMGVGADFNQLKENPQAIIDQAKAFGAKYASCYWIPHPHGKFSIKETQEAIDVFNRAGKTLNDAGITLCYHPHGYEFTSHGQGTLFDEMARNARNYAFNLDVFWVQMGGADPLAIMKQYPNKFPILHLKDRAHGTPGSSDGRGDVEANVVLGTGDIDIRGLIQQARKVGTQYLVIEDESSRSVQQIPLSVAFIKQVLATGGPLVSDHARAAAEPQVLRPFNGKNLEGWKTRRGDGQNLWRVGTATLDPRDRKLLAFEPGGEQLINLAPGHGAGLDLYSDAVHHGDAVITLEVMVPQGSNSGIYVMGEYEVQVLDSYGNDANPGPGDMGAIYGAQPPQNPTYRAPGQWNTYEIHWQAPRFDAQGKKTANASFLKVILNGVVIHENVEMTGPTPAGVDGREKPRGPIMFQGDHGPVAYRNIEIRPLTAR